MEMKSQDRSLMRRFLDLRAAVYRHGVSRSAAGKVRSVSYSSASSWHSQADSVDDGDGCGADGGGAPCNGSALSPEDHLVGYRPRTVSLYAQQRRRGVMVEDTQGDD